jgi:hypothetical protein
MAYKSLQDLRNELKEKQLALLNCTEEEKKILQHDINNLLMIIDYRDQKAKGETKNVAIRHQTHELLKKKSIKENISMYELIEEYIKKGLGLMMLLVMVSCGTTRYVHVDTVNLKRFKHDQKVRPGMSQAEVLEKFGSPDLVRHSYFMQKVYIEFVYFHKIFCNNTSDSCTVAFDVNKKLVYTTRIRMEFDETLIKVSDL